MRSAHHLRAAARAPVMPAMVVRTVFTRARVPLRVPTTAPAAAGWRVNWQHGTALPVGSAHSERKFSIFGKIADLMEDNGGQDTLYAATHIKNMTNDSSSVQIHALKELSWMCADDTRHMGMNSGQIKGNRDACIDEGVLYPLLELMHSDNKKIKTHVLTILGGLSTSQEFVEQALGTALVPDLIQIFEESALDTSIAALTGSDNKLSKKALQAMAHSEEARDMVNEAIPSFEWKKKSEDKE